MAWPFILYLNQVINASVKVFMIFHLSKQKWSNRGSQSAGDGTGWRETLKNAIAKFQMVTALSAFVTGLMIYVGLVPSPF
jgi:glycosyltransferase Alg8